MLSYAILCSAIVCYDMISYAMLSHDILCSAIVCYDTISYAMLSYAFLCFPMLSYALMLAQIEHFCPVLVEIPLDTHPSVTGFLPEAVRFANEKMWGSLTGTLIIDCASRKKAQATFEQAVQSLQVGVLGINKWAAYGVVFPQGSWGAYPKHTPEDIQSGQGIVGNVWCLENVVSTLLDCPFAYLSVPNCPRSIKARRVFMLQQKRVAEFFLDPGLFSLLGVVSALVLQF
eukprot:g71240.t1